MIPPGIDVTGTTGSAEMTPIVITTDTNENVDEHQTTRALGTETETAIEIRTKIPNSPPTATGIGKSNQNVSKMP
jgi:hypothetical protein